ncbi:glycosyltransferase family 4 protein [Thermococcus aggregans]|uniref:Glycosyltransferase family 4 protein n=1 Tax=Thermococcus aggregans TaxID=110163 RepID=A0A9E7N0G8_THEAG|nr:glycosyltransferase family 4 protein [Thermococcus aggregans]USS41779.1 glycosyltransferase family 4 protein [Thermococcus aggregans]
MILIMPYTSNPSWGVENVAYNIVEGLKKIERDLERKDISITIVSDKGNSPRPKTEKLSSRLELISYKLLPPITFFGDVENAFMAIKYLKNHIINADIVHSHDALFSLQFTKLYPKKLLIHHFHSMARDIVPLINSTYLKFSFIILDYRLRALAKSQNIRYVAISQLEKKDINTFFGIPLEHISVIHNPISSDFFEVNKNEENGVIFFPARLIPRKNHPNLIKALGILKSMGVSNFRLILTGVPEDMQYYEEISHLISKLKLQENVMFLGKISRKVLLQYYSKASIVVIPSFRENFSLIAIESMATGTPVVASPVGIVPEAIIPGKNGFIINPRDPKDIAEKLRILLEDNKKRRSMGKNAKKTAEKWRSKNIARDLIKLWEGIS